MIGLTEAAATIAMHRAPHDLQLAAAAAVAAAVSAAARLVAPVVVVRSLVHGTNE